MSPDPAKDPYEGLSFKYPFRRYQDMVLAMFEDIRGTQDRFHIVAPPGSGKTILGIEIIRRIGEPAVIFSPTTTIQEQWKDKFGLFAGPDGPGINGLVSSDAKNLKTVNTLTYQVIGTQTENRRFLEELGIKKWAEDLEASGKLSPEEATDRIELLKANNREAYRKEVSKYSIRAKRELLSCEGCELMDLIHSNARRIIEGLVSSGTKVIVLDECHHLLDYWAIVLKELIHRIPGVFVIGLTATPPLMASEKELENYMLLVGDIDFEVPTPAVVKNRNLAPYQDLAYFVSPTKRELSFIKKTKELFLSIAGEVSETDKFQSYVRERIFDRRSGDKTLTWYGFLDANFELGVAGIRFLLAAGETIPEDIEVAPGRERELSIDDWMILLEDYCLNRLKTSDDKEDWELLKKLKATFRNLGLVLSESGFRRYISPVERVLAFSDAKNEALTEILGRESESLKESLRAVVITDFEKSSALTLRSLSGILDPDAGGAVRALKHLTKDPGTNRLDPVMLTGKSVLIDADFAEEFVERSRDWIRERGLDISLRIRDTGVDSIREIQGSGRDWRPKNYVAYTTWAFEKGYTQCIIGTRGLLGEGWDSLTLNTLIDLSTAGTYATVNQIRGRSLRIDPSWDRKVANNWDIVCVAPGIPRGDGDFARFLKKHNQFYGIDRKGRVVKGPGHVDVDPLNFHILQGIAPVQLSQINSRQMKRAMDRKKAYKLWKVGDPYTNFQFRATVLRKEDASFRSAYTFRDSIKKLLLILMGNLTGYLAFFIIYMYAAGDLLIAAAILLFAVGVATFYSLKHIKTLFRRAFIEIPVDYCLLDIGKAILATLKDLSLVNKDLSFGNLKVFAGDDGTYQIYIDYAGEEDTNLFSACYREAMHPVTDQRYLVSRTDSSLNLERLGNVKAAIIARIRGITADKNTYYPVPKIFSMQKKKVEIYARNWGRYVGGGKLIYTRTPEGRDILIKNRVKDRFRIRPGIIEEWR